MEGIRSEVQRLMSTPRLERRKALGYCCQKSRTVTVKPASSVFSVAHPVAFFCRDFSEALINFSLEPGWLLEAHSNKQQVSGAL